MPYIANTSRQILILANTFDIYIGSGLRINMISMGVHGVFGCRALRLDVQPASLCLGFDCGWPDRKGVKTEKTQRDVY